jgi:hypothetical protein
VVPGRLLNQVGNLFEHQVAIKPDDLPVERTCEARDRPADGDTAGFFRRLIHFTEHQVVLRHHARYGALFSELGIPADGLTRLSKRAAELVERPFCLLHADLHRENFIVDAGDRLWTIDWELAMVGDPLMTWPRTST